MGYEIILSYRERVENGDYDPATKTMKRRVGKAEEEVTPDALAGTIMASLARRDIWVVDVEVFEFTRKKVAFRQTRGGLVIGTKKYNLDQCSSLPTSECEPEAPRVVTGTEVALPAGFQSDGTVNVADLQMLRKKPMRYEVFQPDPAFVDPQRLPPDFTVGDKYPIFAEKAAGTDIRMGMNYTTADNRGRKQVLNDKHFIPAGTLVGGEQFNERRDVALHYGDRGTEASMPVLRGR